MFKRSFSIAFAFVVACGGQTDAPDPSPTQDPSPPVAAPEPAPAAPACSDPSLFLPDPSGWFPSGSNPRGYEMQAAPTLVQCGKPGLHMRSGPTATAGKFGTFMDSISAESYRGKRVRLRATLKGQGLEGWAGLWLRIDGADRKVLGFDNMQERALVGTRDFAEESIVLDVPTEGQSLSYGVLVVSHGEVWAKGIVMEIVGKDVQTTR